MPPIRSKPEPAPEPADDGAERLARKMHDLSRVWNELHRPSEKVLEWDDLEDYRRARYCAIAQQLIDEGLALPPGRGLFS